MKRKIFNALIGFGAGVFTAPLALLAWPLVCAWYLFKESEDGI